MNNNNNEFIFLTNKPALNYSPQNYWNPQLIYRKLFMDLINKLIPTKIQTVIKVFLIRIFPLNFDRWAPKYPPAKEPIINTNNIFEGTDPILAKKTAPIKFQKIPTVKNVILIARRKSISKVFIKSIVTSNPVPEEIEPFNIPIRKIKIKNLILWTKLSFLLPDDKPKSGLRNE